jgi:hypothetical protein
MELSEKVNRINDHSSQNKSAPTCDSKLTIWCKIFFASMEVPLTDALRKITDEFITVQTDFLQCYNNV